MNTHASPSASGVPFYYRPLIPNGCRRAPWHDYHSRCIYLVSINKSRYAPVLSTLRGIPGSHDFKPQTVLTPVGTVIAACLSALKDVFPAIRILRRVIMPEHIHFVLFNTVPTDYNLGDIVCYFKSECTRNILASGMMDNKSLSEPFFKKGYHDRILLKRG